MSHFAIIGIGKDEFEIVPLMPEGNTYISQCRGMRTYSKQNIAKPAVKRLEATLNRRISKLKMPVNSSCMKGKQTKRQAAS